MHWEECRIPPSFCYCLLWGESELVLRKPGFKRWTSCTCSVSLNTAVHDFTHLPHWWTDKEALCATAATSNCDSLLHCPQEGHSSRVSHVFCQAVRKMCSECLSMWEIRHRARGWRNTHFVTLGKSLPPLSSRLIIWDIGFWQDFMRYHPCKCSLSFVLHNHTSVFRDRLQPSFYNYLRTKELTFQS